jgi:glyoxylase-like metal-dependent hydrolase (beta-lactamase superfamily II)
MKNILPAILLLIASAGHAQSPTQAKGPLQLWRLDCGSLEVDLSAFSDTGLYAGQRRMLTSSCYLIRNGDQYLLWDTGLDGAIAGKPRDKDGSELKKGLVTQLARVGVQPSDVKFLGISHYHYDHTGQAADFPQATLLIGKRDFEVVKSREQLARRFAPWLTGGGKVEEVVRDKDVFGDGRVTMLGLPGHTPGHSALLVRLASGPVLLSGDQYHFAEQVANRGVPTFNADRADTLASHDRFDRLAKNLGARVIIQHEPRDISKVPALPRMGQLTIKTEGKSRMYTSLDITRLKFLEGRWSGKAPDGKPFYEEYSFPNPTTMRSRRYADATFGKSTDGSTVSLEGDKIVSRWGEYSWEADSITQGVASFKPVNAPSAFTWRRVDPDKVEVTQKWNDDKGAAQESVLTLMRMPRQ